MNITLKGSNDDALRSVLLFFWARSIVNILKQDPFSGPWTVSGISPFYRTQQNRYFHLETGAETAPETLWSCFRILNDG
jgi:hypothetical protein